MYNLTGMLPNYFGVFFIHLKLELLTQFPAPNNYIYLEMNIFNFLILD